MGNVIEIPPGAKAIPGLRLEIMQRDVAKIIEQLTAMWEELNATARKQAAPVDMPLQLRDMALSVRVDMIGSAIQNLQNFQVGEAQLQKEISGSVEP